MEYKRIQRGSPVFKAIREDQIESERQRFIFMMNKNFDNSYIDKLARKRESLEAQTEIPKPKGIIYTPVPEEEGFAIQKLKRTQDAKTLIEDAEEILEYSLPFDQTEVRLDRLWSCLLLIDSEYMKPSPDSATISLMLRRISYLMSFDVKYGPRNPMPPNGIISSCVNDPYYSSLFPRLFKVLTTKFIKRFFYSLFVNFATVDVKGDSPTAVELLYQLTTLLKVTPKTRWMLTYIKDIIHSGVEGVVNNRFKLACLTVLVAKLNQMIEKPRLGEEKTQLTQVLDLLGKELVKKNTIFLDRAFDTFFMRELVFILLKTCPESHLCQYLQRSSP